MIGPILICVQVHYLVERCNQVQKCVLHDYLFVLWLNLCIGHYSFSQRWTWYLSCRNNRCLLKLSCCLLPFVIELLTLSLFLCPIILEPISTIQVEYFSSENSTLLYFFFQCTLSFAKRKRSTLCFVVNESFFFNFSLLIFLQDSRTQRTLETLTLTLDFSIICFVNYLR